MIFAKTQRIAITAVAACYCVATSAHADAVSDFYRSNPIKYYVSTSPGGGYDLVSRIFVRYFPNHMPGKPSMIVINMPGAAGAIARQLDRQRRAEAGTAPCSAWPT